VKQECYLGKDPPPDIKATNAGGSFFPNSSSLGVWVGWGGDDDDPKRISSTWREGNPGESEDARLRAI